MNQIIRMIIIGSKRISIYREYLMFSVIKNIFYIYIQYMLWSSILSYQHQLQKLPILMLYFIINQFMSIFYTDISMTMSEEIIDGDIINRLCKPISLEKQYLFESIGSSVTRVCTISIINLIFIVYFSKHCDVATLLLFVILLIVGYLLNFVLELFFGSLAFFTQSIWGIDSLKNALNTILSGAIFPIFLYPVWLKNIIDYLPFSYSFGKISEFYILHTSFYQIIIVQMIYIVVIYLLYKLMIAIGLKRLTINGG